MPIETDGQDGEWHFRSEVPAQKSTYLSKAEPGAVFGKRDISSETKWSVCFGSEVTRVAPRQTRVPERIRRIVIRRDRCCQWVNRSTGEICGSTFQLEVDHRTSRWAGGSDNIDNLHALCDHHNRLKYRREVGLI